MNFLKEVKEDFNDAEKIYERKYANEKIKPPARILQSKKLWGFFGLAPVNPTGLISNVLIEDTRKLAELYDMFISSGE